MNFIIKFSHMLLAYVRNITPLVTIFYSPMPYPSTFKVTLTYFQVLPPPIKLPQKMETQEMCLHGTGLFCLM